MFHLCKQSRAYNGFPYCGPTSDYVEAKYNTIEEALAAKKEFTKRNPVGWNIYNAETRMLIDGFDCHGITKYPSKEEG